MQGIPPMLRAGDSWVWRDSYPDCKASDGWTLAYTLVNATLKIDLPALDIIADGAGFLIAVSASVTGAYPAGEYTQSARVSKGAVVQTMGSGSFKILPNLTVIADTRSHARKVLAAIEAVLEHRATLDQENYTIGTRSLSRTPIPELIKLRDLYRQEVKAEETAEALAQGLSPSGRIQVRF